MATANRKAARAQFAAKAKSGRGKVGKAAKTTAAPRRKRKAKGCFRISNLQRRVFFGCSGASDDFN